MPPLSFLGALLALTGFAWLVYRERRHRHKAELREWAVARGLRYVQDDLFRIRDRLVRDFPVPGAADLHVLDVVYATDEQRHVYLFTAEYTLGVTEAHRRESRALGFTEPVAGPAAGVRSDLASGPEHLPLLEQYEHLRRRWLGAGHDEPDRGGTRKDQPPGVPGG